MKIFTKKKILTLFIMIILITVTISFAHTRVYALEADDSAVGQKLKLQNIKEKVEYLINIMIDKTREKVLIEKNWTNEQRDNLIKELMNKTCSKRPTTGLNINLLGFNIDVSPFIEVEAFILDNLSENNNEFARVLFNESKYKDNPIGLFTGKVITHKTLHYANHSLAPIIRIDDTLIGIDKIGHFFEEGYFYFSENLNKEERHEFGLFMEGDPDLAEENRQRYDTMFKKYVYPSWFGFYGSATTGVVSYSDMNANEDGYKFFSELYKDPYNYKFSFSNFNVKNWNEENVGNKYLHGIIETKIQ